MKRQHILLLAVVCLALGGAAISMAAPSIDTSTTDETTNQTELDPDAQLIDINNYVENGTGNYTIQVNASNLDADNDTTAWVLQERGGTNYTVEKYDSPTKVHNSYNGTGTKDYAHFNVTISDEDLVNSDRNKGELVNMTFRFDENASASGGASLGNWTLSVKANGTGHPASVEVVEGAESDESIETTEADPLFSVAGLNVSSPFGDDWAKAETQGNVTNGTKAVFILDNSSLVDDFDRSIGDTDAQSLTDASLVRVSDADSDTTTLVQVYANEAPSDAEGTYAVYNDSYHGHEALEVHTGDEFDDATHIDVTAYGDVGLWTKIQEFGVTQGVTTASNFPVVGTILAPLAGLGV